MSAFSGVVDGTREGVFIRYRLLGAKVVKGDVKLAQPSGVKGVIPIG